MQRISEQRVGGNGSAVFLDSILITAFGEEIEPGVVMILGTGARVTHFGSLAFAILRTSMRNILRFIFNATRGHRLAPWRSPYLRWRIETYTGLKMDKIGFFAFWNFMFHERKELARFMEWTAEMENYARPKPKNK
jgi:hypothetical protein